MITHTPTKHDSSRTRKKPIKLKWIDTNKGDADNPNYRSRFVGKGFNTSEEEGLFAATPPSEGLRYLLSDVASVKAGQEERVIMLNDVSCFLRYA